MNNIELIALIIPSCYNTIGIIPEWFGWYLIVAILMATGVAYYLLWRRYSNDR